jgi:hypothetical protein
MDEHHEDLCSDSWLTSWASADGLLSRLLQGLRAKDSEAMIIARYGIVPIVSESQSRQGTFSQQEAVKIAI